MKSSQNITSSLVSYPYFVMIPGESLIQNLDIKVDILLEAWNALPIDNYILDSSRRRQYGEFDCKLDEREITRLPDEDFIQPSNPLFKNIKRRFDPISVSLEIMDQLERILHFDLDMMAPLLIANGWKSAKIGLHLISVVSTGDSIGSATPEGIHQDGFDFIAMHLGSKINILKGSAVSRIYDLQKEILAEFELASVLDTLILNDRKLFHDVSDLQKLSLFEPSSRSIAVVTFSGKE
jgi:hypothetical protein